MVEIHDLTFNNCNQSIIIIWLFDFYFLVGASPAPARSTNEESVRSSILLSEAASATSFYQGFYSNYAWKYYVTASHDNHIIQYYNFFEHVVIYN